MEEAKSLLIMSIKCIHFARSDVKNGDLKIHSG